jgi:MFS family permease
MKERQKLTIGEWMLFAAACAMLLRMFTPTIRTWKRSDVISIVAIGAWGLAIISPLIIVALFTRSGRAIDGWAWLAAFLLFVALFCLSPPILFTLVRFVRRWNAG